MHYVETKFGMANQNFLNLEGTGESSAIRRLGGAAHYVNATGRAFTQMNSHGMSNSSASAKKARSFRRRASSPDTARRSPRKQRTCLQRITAGIRPESEDQGERWRMRSQE